MTSLKLPTKSVSAHPLVVAALRSIIDSGSEGITSEELSDKHHISCITDHLGRIRSQGVVIDTGTTLYQDSEGKTYKKVIRYIYKGCILK
jgi:hypothetical protein